MKDMVAEAPGSFINAAPRRPVPQTVWLLTLAVLFFHLGQPLPARGGAAAPTGKTISPELNALFDELTRRASELRAPEPPAQLAPRRPMPFAHDPNRVMQGQFLVRLAVIRVRLGDAQGALAIADRITDQFQQQDARAQIAEQLDRNGQTNEATRIRATLTDPAVLGLPSAASAAAAQECLVAGRLGEAQRHLDRALALVSTEWPFTRGDMLLGFGRGLFEAGHTNEALSTLARAVDITRPLLDQAQGNVPWMMLRDTAQLQAQMRDLAAALATAQLIRDPEQWCSAYVLVQRAQIAQGDLEGARRTFDQLVQGTRSSDQFPNATEDHPNAGMMFRDFQCQSARELGARYAKAGRVGDARKLMEETLSRMRQVDATGEQTEFLKQFEAQIPITLVYGLIEGSHFAEAAQEISSIRDEAARSGLASQLEVARVEAGEASGSAKVEAPSPVTPAGKAALARKLAQSGRFAEALKLAAPLPPRDAQSVVGAVVQAAIKSNELAHAQLALKSYPVAQPQGQWDDGGTWFKVALLQQLAKAQAERHLTNEARANVREAAALCEKSQNQNVQLQLVSLVPQLAESGDAELALAALAAQKSRLPLAEVGAATGEALVRSLGTAAAISLARAQKDKNLELYLLLGVAGEMGEK